MWKNYETAHNIMDCGMKCKVQKRAWGDAM